MFSGYSPALPFLFRNGMSLWLNCADTSARRLRQIVILNNKWSMNTKLLNNDAHSNPLIFWVFAWVVSV
jgi:hypothetical protein